MSASASGTSCRRRPRGSASSPTSWTATGASRSPSRCDPARGCRTCRSSGCSWRPTRRSAPCAGTATGPRSPRSTVEQGARLGVWEADVRTALTPYLRPQEAGSRTGVRWATVTDERGAGLRLESEHGMELSALPWTPFEIENAAHHTELPPIYQTVLRPALQRRGVGGDDSWGAQTHRRVPAPDGHRADVPVRVPGAAVTPGGRRRESATARSTRFRRRDDAAGARRPRGRRRPRRRGLLPPRAGSGRHRWSRS